MRKDEVRMNTGDWLHTIVWGFLAGFGIAAGMALFRGIIALFSKS